MGIGAVTIPFTHILEVVLKTYEDGHDLLSMTEEDLTNGGMQVLVEHPSLPEPKIFIGKREKDDSITRIAACGGMGTAEVPRLRMIECHEAMEMLLLDCGKQNCSQKARGQ